MHHYLFRGDRPYYAIDVSDIIRARFQNPARLDVVSSSDDLSGTSDPQRRDEIDGQGERLEAWGLTGWYLTILFRSLGVYDSKN